MSAAPETGARPPAARLRRDLILAGALLVVASVAIQASVLLTPLLTLHIFDGVIASRNFSTLTILAAMCILGFLIGGVLRYLRSALIGMLAERAGRHLQMRALTASVRLALSGDRLRSAIALADTAELRRVLGGTLPSDVLDLLVIPAALAFLWLLHPLFFTVSLAALLVECLLVFLSEWTSRPVLAAASEAQERSRSGLTGALAQRDSVEGLGMMPAVIGRWAPGWLGAQQKQDAAQKRQKACKALIEVADRFHVLAMVGTGLWLLVHNEAAQGAILAALIISGIVSAPILEIAGRWRDISGGLLAWRRLTRLAADGAEPEPVAPVGDAPPGLLFQGVTLATPDGARELVRDLDLRMAPGEAWALLGPNGVGKTTLLRAALGLAAPSAGRVLLDGHDMLHGDRVAAGRRIGYLPQDPQLLDGSVVENILRFQDSPAAEAVAAARRAGVHAMIGRLHRGYDTPAGPAAGLSGGQQRMVALARAFHGSPRLVVLDEPEAGLDAASRGALHDAVEAARADGAVVLLVTHDLRPWLGVLDRALLLKRDGGWQAGSIEQTREDGPCAA